MLPNVLSMFTLIAALGSGIMAGLYFAFSNSVMGALGRLPAAQGITAMNAINVVILNPLFLAVFIGTALVAALLAVAAILGWTPRPIWVLTGAVLYIAGSIIVTMAINVPLNNALAASDPNSAAGATLWAGYLDRWVFWNHIRTLACTGALAAFIAALM
ncbi:MAG TPA: anthrone oxygenase family protein [Mesorhizobium sp.]